jgi:dephospho-CoA kinase
MNIVGLTGGIGSGKSTIAREFKNLGIPVFIADHASKQLLATDAIVRESVKILIGEGSYYIDEKGEVVPDKKLIASKVFNNKVLLESLNKILHPAVRIYFENWLLLQNSPYIIYEAAILLESSGHLMCDYVILVSAGIEERIKRVMQRDHVKREEVESRLHNQWSDTQRIELSDFVIINTDIQKASLFVRSIHEVLLKKGSHL